jgi:hypothetical protein
MRRSGSDVLIRITSSSGLQSSKASKLKVQSLKLKV